MSAVLKVVEKEGMENKNKALDAALAQIATLSSAAGPVTLASWRVQPTRTDVEVELRAEDAVGFLGRVLLVFAELGLFPRAMRVDTAGAAVRDVFLLQGLSGARPPDGVVSLLRRRLAALVPPE